MKKIIDTADLIIHGIVFTLVVMPIVLILALFGAFKDFD